MKISTWPTIGSKAHSLSLIMVRIVALLCVFGLFGCSQSREKIPKSTSNEQPREKVVIYQVFTRLFVNARGHNAFYGTIQENGVSKFNDITDKVLASIQKLGITHVWYTGVIEHAQLSDYRIYDMPLDDADVVKGRAGSPYAIKDYYDVDPDLAVDVPNRIKEFEQLVERTHANGLKVIIDFVPNHVARGYKSDNKPKGVQDLGEFDNKSVAFKPGNNFYYLPNTSFKVPKGYNPLDSLTFPTEDGKFKETPAKATGNDQFVAQPGINEWFETVKLNYGIDLQDNGKKYFDPIPNTWIKMRDILIYWAEKGVDGFRCDMAQMVPVEFWGWAIPQVKAINPQLVFIAEIYERGLYDSYIDEGKFDFLYDKVQLYDSLRKLVNGIGSTSGLTTVQKDLENINGSMLHFLENHDEQRIASNFFAKDPWKAIPAMVISATIDKGPVMIYFGQELGEKGEGIEGFSGDDGRTTIFDYWKVPAMQPWINAGFVADSLDDEQKNLRQFYSALLNLSKSNAAIVDGDFTDLTPSTTVAGVVPRLIYTFLRSKGNDQLLILTSFASKTVPIKVTLPSDIIPKADSIHQYKFEDMLAQDTNAVMDGDVFSIDMPPYSSYVLKVEKK